MTTREAHGAVPRGNGGRRAPSRGGARCRRRRVPSRIGNRTQGSETERLATAAPSKTRRDLRAASPGGAFIRGHARARARRRRARVRQRGVRQGARAAAAAVLQVQGRGLLLQGVPGGRPGLPPPRTARRTRGRPLLPAHPHPHHFPLPVPPAARLPRGRPGTSTSAVRPGRARRRHSSGAPRREARN